ncbi:thioredoxin [Trichomycterus rosablanca]|uniref:thioredoxin n=1 Tax=Trichomycterus rosablanca TaxID=2290929 RepID=UPI002F351EA7
MIVVIENKKAFDAALKAAGNKLVVMNFTATWCGPCKIICPIYKAISENPEYKNVVFLTVDVDDAECVASYCEIKCMPTFQFFMNGKKIDEFSGANQAELEKKINTHKAMHLSHKA